MIFTTVTLLCAIGADTDKRVGQARATQRGWLTPYETCRGCVISLLAALFIGMYWLIPSSCNSSYDPIMIFIVASSIFNAVAYTGGPFPLGYIHPALGNISIGYSGFGIVATVGVPYLYLTKVECFEVSTAIFGSSGDSSLASGPQLRSLKKTLIHSIPIGFLATAIIVVNNLRDRYTDVHAGKRTMAVRFGETFARTEYFLLIIVSYLYCIYFAFEENRYTALLPLLSIPSSIPQLKAVAFRGKDGDALNEHVGGTAKLQMIYCIPLIVGLLVPRDPIDD
jgi:1,4-dihydroxy-2-naphthoate octaprenyltransferase